MEVCLSKESECISLKTKKPLSKALRIPVRRFFKIRFHNSENNPIENF